MSLSFTLPLSNSLVLILRARARACVRPAARRARETGRATVATCAHFAGRAAALECDAHAKRDRVCLLAHRFSVLGLARACDRPRNTRDERELRRAYSVQRSCSRARGGKRARGGRPNPCYECSRRRTPTSGSRCPGSHARATGRETRATSANSMARIQPSDRVRAREAGRRGGRIHPTNTNNAQS